MPHEISPADFDLIVVGTGLQESLLAAGASRAGKKVLHIDTADFYGSHWASHQLGFFERWCKQHASETGPLYKNAEVYKASDAELGPSNEYNIDLAPKLVYSSGRLIDVLLGGAAQNYLEFKLLQQSYVWKDGQVWQVPASRADVFKDSSLTPPEKRLLMRFLQKLQQYAMQEAGEAAPKLDARAFVDVLEAEKLPPQLQEIILYALAFADAAQPLHGRQPGPTEAAQEGQRLAQSASTAGASSAATAKRQPQTESGDGSAADAYSSNYHAQPCAQAADCSKPQAPFSQDCLSSREDASQRQISSRQANLSAAAASSRGLMTHAEGMASLAQYMRSAGRYGTGTGAFLLPVYGGGEMPQAFCRVAAVAGATYVLRQGIREFIVDEGTGRCTALKTESGQELKAAAFAGNPEALSQFSRCQQVAASVEGLSRAVLVLDAPLVQGMSQVLVVMPPGAVGNVHPVRALQLGEAVACAPRDRYIVHLSTLQAAAAARADLQQAAQALADLSSLTAVSSSGSGVGPRTGVAPGTKHTCLSPSNSTADSGVQREQDSSAVGETSARPTGADVDASEMKASRRPRALFLAYYNQALQEQLDGCWSLPRNVALCKLPDSSVAYEERVKEAETRLQQLFPDVHHLFTERSAAGDDSDDEAIQALSEALEGLPAADKGIP